MFTHKFSRRSALGIYVAIAGTVVLGSATASAKTTRPGAPATHAAAGTVVASPAAQSAVPPGYKLVSATFTAGTGGQTNGSVTCPLTSTGVARVPLGGGVYLSSSDLSANINSSYPSGTRWVADVNNNSGFDTAFSVWAVCGKAPRGYSVVTASFPNPAGGQTTNNTVACPTGTKVLGGGGNSSSLDLAVNINSTLPLGNGWAIDMNNGSASPASLDIYAVCGKVSSRALYSIVTGAYVINSAGSETSAFVPCPAGQSAVGGGGLSSSTETAVNMNSSWPSGGGWEVSENNATPSDYPLTPYAVCLS